MFAEPNYTVKPAADRRQESAIDAEAFVWARLTAELHNKPEVAAICRILNTVDQQQHGIEQPKDFFERDLSDARRLYGIAVATINSLDSEILQDAIENVAQLLCDEGRNIAPLEAQSPHLQAHYRRLAQSCHNAIQNTLERLS